MEKKYFHWWNTRSTKSWFSKKAGVLLSFSLLNWLNLLKTQNLSIGKDILFDFLVVDTQLCWSVGWLVGWSVGWLVYQSVSWSVHPSVHPSVCPSLHPSVHPSVCSSVHPSVRSSVRPSEIFLKSNFFKKLYNIKVLWDKIKIF